MHFVNNSQRLPASSEKSSENNINLLSKAGVAFIAAKIYSSYNGWRHYVFFFFLYKGAFTFISYSKPLVYGLLVLIVFNIIMFCALLGFIVYFKF